MPQGRATDPLRGSRQKDYPDSMISGTDYCGIGGGTSRRVNVLPRADLTIRDHRKLARVVSQRPVRSSFKQLSFDFEFPSGQGSSEQRGFFPQMLLAPSLFARSHHAFWGSLMARRSSWLQLMSSAGQVQESSIFVTAEGVNEHSAGVRMLSAQALFSF